MYIQVEVEEDPADGRSYVTKWLAKPDNPSSIEGIYFHVMAVPSDFYKHPEWYYVGENGLRRNKYRVIN